MCDMTQTERTRRWREKNREHCREWSRRAYAKNPDKFRQYRRKWRQTHHEEVLVQEREQKRARYPEANEHRNTKRTELRSQIFDALGGPHCINCPCDDKLLLEISTSVPGTRERYREAGDSLRYYRDILDNVTNGNTLGYRILCCNCRWLISQQLHPSKRKWTYDTRWREFGELLGDHCARCGFDDTRALHIDHVADDGAEHRKRAFKKASREYYDEILQALREGSKQFQLLCPNCNRLKAIAAKAKAHAAKSS